MSAAPVDTALGSLSDNTSFDLVVIGSGAAGMSAALNAAIDGARVLLVEKTEYLGGTTAMSAATSWIPLTTPGLLVNPDDTLVRATTFLDKAVGERSDAALRQAFLAAGPAAVSRFEAHSELKFQVRNLHPDYLSELEGSVLRGRAIEPRPFDGRRLGRNIRLLRPPIPEFTVLGGMMVDRDDIFHLLHLKRSLKSLRWSLRILGRHLKDRIFWPRATRLVMGNALIGRMLYSLLQKKVAIVTRSQPVSLLQENGKVVGVKLRSTLPDGTRLERTVRATAGVVLASGGFNRNEAERAQRLPGVPQDWCPGGPGHRGEAQALALAAGASFGTGGLSDAFWAPVSLRKRGDGSTAAFPHFVMDRGKPGMITVDQEGQRYLNESTSYHLFGLAMQQRGAKAPAVPSWLVCDAGALKRYGLGMIRPGGKGLAPFLADGYLTQAASIEALATKLAINADSLKNTIGRFNALADGGIDEDFQRGTTDYQRANGDAAWGGSNPCLGALREAPFYAIRLYPGDIGAATGLRCDAHARVLDQLGQAIEGLYACGNDMHSIMGGVYPAPGITIGPALVFGYLAAQHALARSQP